MAEKSRGKSTKRSFLARKFVRLGKLSSGLPAGLTLVQILLGILIALVITSLLVGFEFERIPEYQVGDIADRTIEAPFDFTVEDLEATQEKKQELLRSVPAVFELDLKVNSRLLQELRNSFADARRLIEEEKARLNLPPSRDLSEAQKRRLLIRLQETFPRFNQGKVLQILLDHSFSESLENQLAALLEESMKFPGVVLNRDTLLQYQDRGIILRNTVTGQDQSISDWMSIRDLNQARDLLRQNEYQLTAVEGEEKKELIGFLDSWIVPNVHFSEAATRDLELLASSDMDPVLIQVKKGKTIVRAGDDVTEKKLAQLQELRKLKQPGRIAGRSLGIFLVVGFFLFALWRYFLVHRKENRKVESHYLLLVLVLTLSLVVTKIFMALGEIISRNMATEALQDPLHFYLLAPVALGTILIVLLVDVNLAILYSLIFAVFVGILTGETPLVVYCLTGSLAAIYALEQYRERSAIIRAGMVIGSVNLLVALALQLYDSEVGFQWTVFFVRSGLAVMSGVLAAMLASLLLPVLESLFEITTDIRLLELSNLNSPILRRLAVEAPGTYHHSIIVGTLAEAAAEAIQANSLLVRVGAYYHDIGKLKKPEYYVENQIYASNKHEKLSPSMSSLILASHVKDGLAMAEEIKLVPKVRELIPQHHGTRLMTYFYQKARDAADQKNGEVSESDFRYPGPKPQSKEAAILMLADQVEAAARTLQEPSPGQIRSLIERLIQNTIQDGQFDECDITMKELNKVARAFQRVLTGMYHHRIEYPGFDFNRQVEGRRAEHQRIQ